MLAPILLSLAFALPGSPQQVSPSYRSLPLEALEQRLAAGEDTVYLVNFWATWCGPCIAEMPILDAYAEAHGSAPSALNAGAQNPTDAPLEEVPFKLLFVSVDAPSRAARSLDAFLKSARAPKGEVLHLNEAKPHRYIDRIHPEWSGSIPATLIRGSATNPVLFHEGELDEATLDALMRRFGGLH